MADRCFRLPFEKSVKVFSSVGSKEAPIYEYNEEGELVLTDKKDNVYARIQSFKDEVLLENIIKRCALTGETLSAPEDCFGDSRMLPKDLLDLKQQGQKVQSFVDKLSDDDLQSLNEKGFDAFLMDKISALKEKKVVEEVKKDE